MNGKSPHIVQYQGSKRILAPQILQYMPKKFNRLIEPFSGMAAITIAVAMEKKASEYIINDLNEPLVRILREAVENPLGLVEDYRKVWEEQFGYPEGSVEHYYKIREKFNAGKKTPQTCYICLLVVSKDLFDIAATECSTNHLIKEGTEPLRKIWPKIFL